MAPLARQMAWCWAPQGWTVQTDTIAIWGFLRHGSFTIPGTDAQFQIYPNRPKLLALQGLNMY